MATETSLWKWLAKARDLFGDRLHMCRMENLVTPGASDVEGCLDGVQFWVELKICSARPARARTLLRFGSPLRDSQLEWTKARIAAGGRVSFLIQVGAGSDRAIYLIPGHLVEDLHAGVNEEWCRGHSALDVVSPVGVLREATR